MLMKLLAQLLKIKLILYFGQELFCHGTKNRLLSYKALVPILVSVGALGTFFFNVNLEVSFYYLPFLCPDLQGNLSFRCDDQHYVYIFLVNECYIPIPYLSLNISLTVSAACYKFLYLLQSLVCSYHLIQTLPCTSFTETC